MNAVKTLALSALLIPALAACTHHAAPKAKAPPRADYSARCMGNDYQGCYEEAREKCKGTAGYKVFAKKNNMIGKEIMYSCAFKK